MKLKLFSFLAVLLGFSSCYTSRSANESWNSSPSDANYIQMDNSDNSLELNQLYSKRDNPGNSSQPYSSQGPSYSANANNQTVRKIIYNGSMHLRVKSKDSLMTKMESIAQEFGGYLVSFSDNKIVLKVDPTRLNDAMLSVSNLGKASQKEIKSTDVTMQYTDLEIALENAQKARLRYLELLENAQNVSDMLAIEKELERINRDIDLLKSRLNGLNSRIQYAELVIYVQHKVKPGVLGYVGIGLYKSVKWLFVRG